MLDGYSIKRRSFIVLYKSQTKISLNDDSEVLFLIDPKEKTTSKVNIPRSTKYVDRSWSCFGSDWSWTKTATLLAKNTLEPLDDPQQINSAKSSSERPESKVQKAPKIKKTKQKSSDQEEETVVFKKTATTTIRKAIPATLSNARLKPVVFGSSIVKYPTVEPFIRLEYLLYFFGFVAFLLVTLFYDFYYRE